MDYEENKKYLQSYRELKDKLEFINTQIEGVKGINYEPITGGLPKTINDLMDEKDITKGKMRRIVTSIDNLEDVNESLVVWYRYVDNCSIKAISKKIHYTERHTLRILKKGIENIKK